MCIIMQNVAKIGFADIAIFRCLRCRPSPYWNFQNFKIFNSQLGTANMHQCTKFHQNWCNNYCGDIALNVFFKMVAVRHLGFLEI